MTLTAIRLDEETFPNYKTLEEDNALTNLSRINIFIGANNAGKSRLMRMIFAKNNFEYRREDCDLNELDDMILDFHKNLAFAINNQSIVEIPSLLTFAKFKYSYLKPLNSVNKNITSSVNKNIISYVNVFLHGNSFTIKLDDKNTEFYPNALVSNHSFFRTIEKFKDSFNKLANSIEVNNRFFTKSYIPILRGLRPIQNSMSHILPNLKFTNDDSYKSRTIFDYFKGEKELEKLSISTGLDFFERLRGLKNGDVHEQDLIKEFEDFLSVTFFQNQPIVITAHQRKEIPTFRIGQGEAFPIYDLGDGIQAIILLTYPLFFNKGKDMIFFFEEPEIYLHPGFQRIFIDTLLSKRFSSFQYFFSTHSNHFLDITLDHDNISIYNFRKEKSDSNKFVIENVQCGDNSLLEELGVKNASVFLSNCTIWVEGISDRIYIRKYLEVLIEKKVKEANLNGNTEGVYFREDYHYSFVEYSGNNITHWSFLDDTDEAVPNINVDRICKRIFLVTDQDGAGEVKDGVKTEKEAKLQRQEKLKDKLGEENYHCLNCREIENALSPHILKKVIEGRRKTNKETEAIEYKGKWAFEDYKDKKLGEFYENHVGEASKKIINKINDKGTIYDKIGFAKAAVAAIESYDDLSEPAKVLTEKIYAFIKKNNQ